MIFEKNEKSINKNEFNYSHKSLPINLNIKS